MLYILARTVLAQPSLESFVRIIQRCSRRQENNIYTFRLFSYVCKIGLQDHVSLRTPLICLFVEFQNKYADQEVFFKLPCRTQETWNSLMTDYVKCRKLHHGFILYKMMKHYVDATADSLVALMKACVKFKDLKTGLLISREILKNEQMKGDSFIVSNLIKLYTEFGLIDKAYEAFNVTEDRHLVSWNALTKGYIDNGFGSVAIQCFNRMALEGVLPNVLTYICTLKACTQAKTVSGTGKGIHSMVFHDGLVPGNVILGGVLVDMYAKCGLMMEAEEVFCGIQMRDTILWTALISGYVEQGQGEQALKRFSQMQFEGVAPDAVTFVLCLKACGSIGAIEKGQTLHVEVCRVSLLESNLLVGTSLVDMYTKCGVLGKAKEVFDKLKQRNVVSWTALIAGYAEHGHYDTALECFTQMQLEDVSPNTVTLVCTLKACGGSGDVGRGQEIHTVVEVRGLLEKELAIGNALVDMYAKCGFLADSKHMFDRLSGRNMVSWNVMISAYTKHEHDAEALKCLEQMQNEGFSPDSVTFASCLKVCTNISFVGKGQEIHAEVCRNGLLEKDLVIASALVDMYVKCGFLEKANEVIYKHPTPDICMWTTLIGGYANNGYGEKALNSFEQMKLRGVSPNAVTIMCCLKACSSIRALDKGEKIHREIERNGLFMRETSIGNSLIDMYSKCGSLTNAQDVFEKLHARNVVSWNILITNSNEHENGKEVFKYIDKMQHEGVCPDAVTFLAGLNVCAKIGTASKGLELHAEIVKRGYLDKDPLIGNALVDMYSKCGSANLAQNVFEKLPVQDLVSWNSLICAYVQVGESGIVFEVFEKMVEMGVKPNVITFSIILKACSARGLFDQSHTYFQAMSREHGISPTHEHYSCVVDCLARSGELGKAASMVEGLSLGPEVDTYNALLQACRKCGNVDLGKLVFTHTIAMPYKT